MSVRYRAAAFGTRLHDAGRRLNLNPVGKRTRGSRGANRTDCRLMEDTKVKYTRKIKIFSITLGLVMAFSVISPRPAAAQSEPLLGQLMLFGGNFCPRGWTNADGQLLPISSNSALFSLFGTMYGGDGRTTFGLPDLRGRAAIHTGRGPGLANYRQGSKGGAESLTVTVTTNNMPSHKHAVQGTNSTANLAGPGTDLLARNASAPTYHNGPANVTMDASMITNTGGGQPITVQKRSPFLTLRWCVALQGVFPSRN